MLKMFSAFIPQRPKSAFFFIIFASMLYILVPIDHSNAASTDRSNSAEYFSRVMQKWTAICSNQENNVVLRRRDGSNIDNKAEGRTWSLQTSDILLLATRQPGEKRHWCLTTTQVKSAIALPIRSQPCLLRWYTQTQICELFQKYAVILWHGDSLTRHMSQGLFMLWTADFRFGAYLRNPKFIDDVHFDSCGCDGQFSENLRCRTENSPNNLAILDARSIGLCTNLHRFKSPRFYYGYGLYDESRFTLCSNDTRLRFIFLQGGTHYDTNSSATIVEYLQPTLLKLVISYFSPLLIYMMWLLFTVSCHYVYFYCRGMLLKHAAL
jgi:hypothetical protein